MSFDPTRCANCASPLRPDWLIIDRGTLSWYLCGWDCVREFAEHPDTRKAIDTAQGTLHRAWSRGPIRWQVYRTPSGGLLRKVTEYLIPFRSLAGAVAAAKFDEGTTATEIRTQGP